MYCTLCSVNAYLFLLALKRISSIVAFNDPDSSSLRISLEANKKQKSKNSVMYLQQDVTF